MSRIFPVVLLVQLGVALAGCATSHTERELNFTASALTKVSAAVDSTVRYTQVLDQTTSAELLALSTEHDPELMEPFKNFRVLVRRVGPYSEVLVCEPDGSRGLLEDAGCTAKLDKHLWRDDPPALCQFTLELEVLCKR
jgi:hypothetical protein